MISSLSNSTIKQYNCAYKKWWHFCTQNGIDCYEVNIPLILQFFTLQYKSGAGYSTLNTLRSAIALILGKTFSEDDRVTRFLKGVFKTKPSWPKYQVTWDPNVVLDFLANLPPNEHLSIEVLTRKLVALIALSTAQRVQTLSLIRLSNVKINASNVEIVVDDLIKTSAPGRTMPRLIIPFFPHKVQICPAKTLCAYVEATSNFRCLPHTERLILTTKKPVHNASASTIARWIKRVLTDSGIDTTIFSAHSTRHATTSAASRRGISIDIIKKSAGWSDDSLVFAKFYNRPLIEQADSAFADAIYNNNDVDS